MRLQYFLILSLVNLFINGYSQQTYFNDRYELYSPGSWDALDNCLEVQDGYIVSGGTGHPGNHSWNVVNFTKLDYQGNIIWTKILGDTIARYFNGFSGSLIKMMDGGYGFGGSREYPGDTAKDIAIICKLDSNFDTIWIKEYGNTDNIIDTVSLGLQIKELPNGDIILVGSQYYHGTISKHLLVRTDSLGNKIWEKTYGTTGVSLSFTVIPTTDGGFAFGGFWYIAGNPYETGDPILIKTDSLGNKEWEKDLGGPFEDNKAIVCSSHDGHIIAAMDVADSMLWSNQAYNRTRVVKLDNSGNILWSKKFGKSKVYNHVTNIRCLDDGSLILCGTIPSEFPYIAGWILKLSPDGDSIWHREYGNLLGYQSMNQLHDVIQVSDDGFLASGWVYPLPPDTGTQDAWVIKVDSFGCDTPDCQLVKVEEITDVINEPLMIYPNPANCEIQIDIRYSLLDTRYSIFIYDLYGRKQDEVIVPAGQERIRVDVSSYPAGIYIAVLRDKKRVFGRGKLVVKH